MSTLTQGNEVWSVVLLSAILCSASVYAGGVENSQNKINVQSEIVDCFYEQNAGHLACQKYSKAKNTGDIAKPEKHTTAGVKENSTRQQP